MNIKETVFLMMFGVFWSLSSAIRDPIFQLMSLFTFIISLLLPLFHIKKILAYYFFVIGFALFRLIRYFTRSGNSADYVFIVWINEKIYFILVILSLLSAFLALFLYLKKYKQKAKWFSIFSIVISILISVSYAFVEYGSIF